MSIATAKPGGTLVAAAWMAGAIASFSILAVAARAVSPALDTFEISIEPDADGGRGDAVVLFAQRMVAAGAADIALAMGVEKLKDTGFAGLPERTKGTFDDLWQPGMTPQFVTTRIRRGVSWRGG